MIFDIDVIPHCKTIVHCDLPLYFYRYNPYSLTTTYRADRFEKNIEQYHEMWKMLKSLNYNDKEIIGSLSRYLLTAARISIFQEAEFVDKNGRHTARKNIERICDNFELKEILKKYNYGKLPTKYGVICYLIKHKSPGTLLALGCINEKRKALARRKIDRKRGF
jgi:hypothetical protein